MSMVTHGSARDSGTWDIAILHVEDDEATRESITALLSNYVNTVASASNGKEGLDLYKQGKYDIVLTDMDMPVMNGYAMAKHIKEIDKDQVIIAVSAYKNSEHLQDLIDMDINYFILKPIDTMKALKTFRMACERIMKERAIEYRCALLENREEIFRRICSAAQDAMIVMDDEGTITFWNKAASLMFHYREDEVMGKELHSLIVPVRYYPQYKEAMDLFTRHGQGRVIGKTIEIEAVSKHGKEFPVELSVSSLQINGKWHATGIVRDITDRKMKEREIQRHHDLLDAMIENLEKKIEERALLSRRKEIRLIEMDRMAGLTTFSSGIAHEINNPLSFVNSSVHFLKNSFDRINQIIDYLNNTPISGTFLDDYKSLLKNLDITQVKSLIDKKLHSANKGIKRIMDIVLTLRSFSRLDMAETDMLNINQSIEETASILSSKYTTVNIVKELSLIPLYTCEPKSINQCIFHILDNAMEAVEENGTIWIMTSYDEKEDTIEIRVDDDGRGMPKEVLSKAFIPFFTTKEIGSGKGLGLSLTEGIIQRHGGFLTISSTEGEGTRVTIRLPLTCKVNEE